jgi:hypothetical protein
MNVDKDGAEGKENEAKEVINLNLSIKDNHKHNL